MGSNQHGRKTGKRRNDARRPTGAEVIPFSRNRSADTASRRSHGDAHSTSKAVSLTVGKKRVVVVLGAFALASACLFGRAVHMSLADAHRLQAPGLENAARTYPERGSIVSADGRELAASVRTDRVIATPYQVEDPEEAASDLSGVISPVTGQEEDDIRAALDEKGEDGELRGYAVVATVPPEVAEKVANLDLEGISLEPSSGRVYPDGSLASQLLGHVSEYGEAFGGVEARYDETLTSGRDVHLTLDSAVQQELQSALADAVRDNDADNAVGVVMRVEDGAVVALANQPTYDNNDFSEAPAEDQRDRVLTDPYEPGSTFKPFTFAAALEKGAVSEQSSFTIPDNIAVADRVINDSLPHATEVMPLVGILEESSNVGTIQVAQAVGGEAIVRYLERFGFGQKTGLDLPEEDPGVVPRYEEWSGVSIGNIPIGQGLTVTPLQLAAGYAAIANGGVAVTPRIVASEAPAESKDRVISEKTSTIVRGMLQSVVDNGTGTFAHIPGYTVAGKTGTSQKVDPETGTYGDDYYASFVGFAPAKDPKYVTVIVVDSPKDSIWGESVAAPAFEKVMSFTLGYFNVPPDRPETRR